MHVYTVKIKNTHIHKKDKRTEQLTYIENTDVYNNCFGFHFS